MRIQPLGNASLPSRPRGRSLNSLVIDYGRPCSAGVTTVIAAVVGGIIVATIVATVVGGIVIIGIGAALAVLAAPLAAIAGTTVTQMPVLHPSHLHWH